MYTAVYINIRVKSKQPEESSPSGVFSAQLPLLLPQFSNLLVHVVHLREHNTKQQVDVDVQQ